METLKMFNLTILIEYILQRLLIHVLMVGIAATLSRSHTGRHFRPIHKFLIHIVVTIVIAFGVSEIFFKIAPGSIMAVVSFMIGLSTDHIASIALSDGVQKTNAESIWTVVNTFLLKIINKNEKNAKNDEKAGEIDEISNKADEKVVSSNSNETIRDIEEEDGGSEKKRKVIHTSRRI